MKRFFKFLAFVLCSASLAFAGCDNETVNDEVPGGDNNPSGGGTSSNTELSITVSDITTDSAKVKVTALNDNVHYLMEVVPYSLMEATGKTTAKAYAEFRLLDIKQRDVEAAGKQWIELLDFGTMETSHTGLSVDTEYVAYAGVVDMETGTFASDIVYVEFRTEPKPYLGELFDIRISNIQASKTTIDIVRANDDIIYNYFFNKKEYFDIYPSIDSYVELWVESTKNVVDNEWTWWYKEGDPEKSILLKENLGFTVEGLWADEEYMIVCAAITDNGEFLQAEAVSFKTTELILSDNTFTIDEESGIFSITPSNDDRFFWDIDESSKFNGMSDQQIIDLYMYSDTFTNSQVKSGYVHKDYMDLLTKDVSYTIIVFGWEGGATTPLTKYEFTFTGAVRTGFTTLRDRDVKLEFSDNVIAKYGSKSGDMQLLDEGTGVYIRMNLNPERANASTGAGTYEVVIYDSLYDESGESDGTGESSIRKGTITAGLRWSYITNPGVSTNISYTYDGSFWGVIPEKNMDPKGFMTFFPREYLALSPSPGSSSDWAAFDSGTVTVTVDADKVYTVEIDVKDPRGNRIFGTYTGTMIEMYHEPLHDPEGGE